MKHHAAPILVALALALACCGKSEPVADEADNTAGLNAVIAQANETASQAHGNAGASAPAINERGEEARPGAAGQTVIPAQFRGTWGLVAADCTSASGDAKGLITVGDTSIRFYESTAALKERRPAIAEAFSGLFSFTGEGRSWQKVETLTRTGGALKRADDEGSYTYQRCA